jgi:tetratricopeptide (TPR) repeat protein
MLIFLNAEAQNPRKFYKKGNDYVKAGNYEMAVEQFSQAVELDPGFIKAIDARALAYEQLGDFHKSANDYETLSELLPGDFQKPLKAAGLYFKVGQFQKAGEMIALAEEINQQSAEVFSMKAKCLYALKKYDDAIVSSGKAIEINSSPENYYVRGIIGIELKKYEEALADFTQAVKLNPGFTDALVKKSHVLIELKREDEALTTLNSIIGSNGKNKEAYSLRAGILENRKEYNSAIMDLTTIVSFSPETKVYFKRAFLYQKNMQYSEAADDYTRVLISEKANLDAYKNRAECYLRLDRPQDALKDYKQIISLASNDKNAKALADEASLKIAELEREFNKPEIFVKYQDKVAGKTIEIADGLDFIIVRVKATDDTRIGNLRVNDIELDFHPDSIGFGQEFRINVKNSQQLNVIAEDIYRNKASKTFKLERRDEGLPKIALLAPTASESGIIYLKSFDPEVGFEGRIISKNLIDSLSINGKPVSFNKSSKNPSFRAKIELSGLDKIEFFVRDNMGNQIHKELTIDRSDAELFSENPMGRTWVVFVENSDYESFTDLEGPKREVDLMIKALAKYRIDKIIHKRNLTKKQMEYFFATDLKNQVIENRVNALMIWYAGHGKSVGAEGYWIPVDSKLDDLSSYFNISSLRASIKPYVQHITHSLIVTDACETGPSFYMAMRNIPAEKNCSDTKSTRFKSSQVFTSSGNDIAGGDSQFTKSFANSLMFDNNSCVPIERIVNKVSSEVSKANNKRPKFGKIAGFEDENGTFLFIKK